LLQFPLIFSLKYLFVEDNVVSWEPDQGVFSPACIKRSVKKTGELFFDQHQFIFALCNFKIVTYRPFWFVCKKWWDLFII